MKITIIDGQGGKMWRMLIERIKSANLPCEVIAIDTNSMATSVTLKAGADAGATGKTPSLSQAMTPT